MLAQIKPTQKYHPTHCMNLKNALLMFLAAFSWPLVAAPSALIPATALLDTPPGYNAAAGAALLTDGTIGGNNWLGAPAQYLGWTDPGYVPTDGGIDSAVAQPQLTFN